MRVICGWCRTFIRETIPFDDGKQSHGICQKCADELRHELEILRECNNIKDFLAAKRQRMARLNCSGGKENEKSKSVLKSAAVCLLPRTG